MKNVPKQTAVLCRISLIFMLVFTGCEQPADPLISAENKEGQTVSETDTRDWGEWTPTGLAGTEERKTADGLHTEQRLTGTGRFTFNLISGSAAYSVSKGTDITGIVRIPDYYRPSDEVAFQPVTAIGSFSSCQSLTGIIIPNSVTSIDGYAFSGCIGLINITIPNSVTSIGDSAFNGSGLETVTFAEGFLTISNWFIGLTSLTGITIPASVTTIDDFAFSGCTSLTDITIPNSVTSIGS